ncbi:hybrid sensor histidine kinase/response regulator transcription factor [Aquimarina agarilytica]|uniref:hybrid sensor histidine kinase/response regulator transcription factor n=1 Tax=Aquimarina agarilytica TaxID=1087449 RepID=UPI00028938B9|nr:hybrid sensor histidine kinase/response regulator transcription factor [Aquimarina agarilytica]
MFVKNYTLAFIFILLLGKLYGQTLQFDHFYINDGLSDNSIFSTEIDQKGHIWLGTRNGLNKFNGKTFISYKPNINTSGNIIGNNVTAIKKDTKGHIWALTNNGGLNKLDIDKKRFIHFNLEPLNNFPDEWPGKILIGKDSLIWIKKKNGLGVFNATNNQFYSKKEFEFAPSFIFSKNSASEVLCSGKFGIIAYQFNSNKFISSVKYTEPVYYLSHFKSNYIIATKSGVHLLDKNFKLVKRLLNYKKSPPYLIPHEITSLIIDDINLWIGTTKGLHLFSKKESQTHNASTRTAYNYRNTSLSEHAISTLNYDTYGNLWIGTSSFGIYLHSKQKNQFNFISRNKTALNSALKKQINPVSAILKTVDNKIWVGTKNKGIEVFDKIGNLKNYTQYFDQKGQMKPIFDVREIFQDSNQNIWVATANFVGKFNSNKDRIETLNHSFNWDWPYQSYCIKELLPGTLFLTGSHFIAEVNLNTGELKKYPVTKNNTSLQKGIRDIGIDQNHTIWVAQNTFGLVKIDQTKNTYTHFSKSSNGITDNKIYALEIDNDFIWLATNSGLNLFSIAENKVIKTFFEEDGLSSNIIYSVKLESDKNLWMSTSKGISKLNTDTHKITNYLLDEFFLDDAFYFYKDHTYLYGGYQDIISFNPKKITDNTIKATSTVDNFYLANRLIKVGDSIKNSILLTDRITNNTEIKLNHRQNSFSLSFDAYPVTYFKKHKIRYKLEGLQNKWLYQTAYSTRADYTTVPPGKYTFKTSVLNNDHSWSAPSILKINITPPFWQTSWFKIATIGLLFFGFYGFVQLRTLQLKKSKIRLAKKVSEQTKVLKQQNEKITSISKKLHEADQSKLQLFTNISHEFRTPLTLILGHLENSNKFEHSKLIIKKNANRLLEMVNQLIEIRKIDQKKLHLKVTSFDLVNFTANIVASFQVLAKEKNINLHFYSAENKLYTWLDPEKTEKIIFNLLTNALKYTPKGESIYVDIHKKETTIDVIIKDTGIGISEKSLPLIFERFYRTNHENFEGHGIGLALAKELVKLLHGTITATSKLNEGSTFTVTFKQGKDHFNKKDIITEQFKHTQETIPIDTPKNKIKHNFGSAILIVEDNVELTNYIIDLLEDNYVLKTASNGLEGLQLLNEFKPDLIISDIMMPTMNGIEFCNSVKSNIETSHIPFILLTAVTDIETKIKGFSLGIDSYIEKPFNANELRARIAALLANRTLFKKHILTYNANNEINKKWLNDYDAIFWKKVNTLINENFTDHDFNAEKLAPLLHMSRATFYRKFKDLTGLNIAEHIRKTRLHKAKELLLNDQISIGELGSSVGFKSSSQFRINFKAEFGDTPSQFIKKQKG